jgi:2-oxoglutarate ferredoxin oxidoreductase subunit beta
MIMANEVDNKEKTQKHRHRLYKYLREEVLPTAFCPGCGCGIVLNCFAHAVDELQIDPKDMVAVTGIGCSSWIPSPYLLVDTLHTTHGRPIPFATGVKVANPDKTVVVIAGDGDLIGIGGNHLIHAARRNIDIKVFLVNNLIYGMTGGQVAPTTPSGIPTATSPYGNLEHPFEIAELVAAAGATYVTRWTTYHVFPLMESMQKALTKKGFSFIEIRSPCPTSYGRKIDQKRGSDTMLEYKESSVRIQDTAMMSSEELNGKVIIGKFVEKDKEEFTDNLRKINQKVRNDKIGRSPEEWSLS